MSILPLGRLFGLASVVLSATTLYAQLTTYTYQGKPFTTFTALGNGVAQGPQPFITSDALSGEVTFFSPLPPNQSGSINLANNIASFSFTDGSAAIFAGPLASSVFGGSVTPINTWNTTNSTVLFFFAITDAQGQIIAWSTQISSCCVLPVPGRPPLGLIDFEIATCGSGPGPAQSTNACTSQDSAFANQSLAAGQGISSMGELTNNQGSWGTVSFPPLHITTKSVQNPLSGQQYNQTIMATGGSGNGYVWSILSGAPPPGFKFSPEASCGPACTSITLSWPGDPVPPNGAYNFTVQVMDSAGNTATQQYTLCLANVQLIAQGEKLSRDRLPTQMIATLAAPSNSTLIDYAHGCGFDAFDWVQTVVEDLSGDTVFAELDPTKPLKPSYPDPPLGGYSYQFTSPGVPDSYVLKNQPHFQTANPFYYSPKDLDLDVNNVSIGCASASPPSVVPYKCTLRISDLSTLHFFDYARDPNCLPSRHCLGFQTQLVGAVCGDPPTCNSVTPSSPLFQWSWSTNFNGSFGGIFMIGRQSVFPPDVDSGTGGVTITSINGIRQTPPSLTCSATPGTLWPPNGKPVLVTVSGIVTPGTQAIPADGATFTVADEYQMVQPSGSFTVGAGGSYSFTVPLIAARNGDDLDGRTYTIVTVVRDNIGNAASCSSVVTVPHDQGN